MNGFPKKKHWLLLGFEPVSIALKTTSDSPRIEYISMTGKLFVTLSRPPDPSEILSWSKVSQNTPDLPAGVTVVHGFCS